MTAARVAALALCASCSFFAVKGPQSGAKPIECTDSDIIPSIDAAAGVLLTAGALGGELADHLASHPIANYELIIGLPALALGITYLVAASHGTDNVSTCQAAKHGRERGCDGCPADVP